MSSASNSSSSASSSATATTTPATPAVVGEKVSHLDVTVGAGQALLVRGPAVHPRFPILGHAWFEVGSAYYSKQFVNGKCMLVADGTDPNAEKLPMNVSYMRFDIKTATEFKVVSEADVSRLLQDDAAARFDRENQKAAAKQ